MNSTMKILATVLLLLVLALFVTTVLLRPVGLLGAVLLGAASAGLVGAITDWFAVSALFRRIPIPGLSGSTDVVVVKRKEVEGALIRLLNDKVISPEATRQWLSETPLTQILFESDANKQKLKKAIEEVSRAIVAAIPTESISDWIVKEIPPQIRKMELRKSFRSAAEYVTSDVRFDALCRSASGMIADVLENKVVDQVGQVFLSEATDRFQEHLHSKGIIRLIRGLPIVGDAIADFVVRLLIRNLHSRLESRITEIGHEWVSDFRLIASGGRAGDYFQTRYDAGKAWLKATILKTAESDQPVKLVEEFLGDVERNPSGFSKKIAGFLESYRNELLRPENPRLASLADWMVGDVAAADGNHWINRIVTDGLPELLGKKSFAPIIQEGLARISDGDLRRYGAERLESDLSAIRVTGTIIGLFLGGIVHATIWIANNGI